MKFTEVEVEDAALQWLFGLDCAFWFVGDRIRP